MEEPALLWHKNTKQIKKKKLLSFYSLYKKSFFTVFWANWSGFLLCPAPLTLVSGAGSKENAPKCKHRQQSKHINVSKLFQLNSKQKLFLVEAGLSDTLSQESHTRMGDMSDDK